MSIRVSRARLAHEGSLGMLGISAEASPFAPEEPALQLLNEIATQWAGMRPTQVVTATRERGK